jgi:hypothetical protein
MTMLTAPPANQTCRSLKVNGTRHAVLTRSLKDDRVRLIDYFEVFEDAEALQRELIAEYNVPEVTHLVKITCL